MSSAEEDFGNENRVQSNKKHRVQRKCDICRRRKFRCDGSQMLGNKCSSCATHNYECTYVGVAKKRRLSKGYVQTLENRLQKMEALLNKLCPDTDFSDESGLLGKESGSTGFNAKSNGMGSASPSPIAPAVPNSNSEDLVPSDDETVAQRDLIRNMKQMGVYTTQHKRFFGKSSNITFIQTAVEAKYKYAGLDLPTKSQQGWRPLLPSKRPQFWGAHPIHRLILGELHQEKLQLRFPDQELLESLIELYFTELNDYQPLLHRPTFEQSIEDGLHERDEGFGLVVLLVCATGSRFSNDPHVFLEGSHSALSSGWEWFRQVQFMRKSFLTPPTLYDIQICALTAIFLQTTSARQASWTIVGIGIRMAQDVGVHRRKVYTLAGMQTVDQELWKRAFWILVSMDRVMSMTLGRPCAVQDEDFDVDLPVECDDEYWILHDRPNPGRPQIKCVEFKQPPGKPSKIAYFNCFLRLNQILAFALRTIYSINKSKALTGFVGTQWEQHIVAELDSALNNWMDSVSDHLRWDPNRENELFLSQSASLYASYYQLQITVHRPFIPLPGKPSTLSLPSLAICTNAARSCINVLNVPYTRVTSVHFANMTALFMSGIVLLLNIWGGKRSGLSTDSDKEMEDVHKCMNMLKRLELRWQTAGRFWDVLYELASVDDLSLPNTNLASSNERSRNDSDEDLFSPQAPPIPASMETTSSDPDFASPNGWQNAWSHRMSQEVQQQETQPHAPQQSSSLPQSQMHQRNDMFLHPSPLAFHQLPQSGRPMQSAAESNTGTGIGKYDLPMYTAGPSASSSSSSSAAATTAFSHPPRTVSSYEQVMSTMLGAPHAPSLDGYPNVLETSVTGSMSEQGPKSTQLMGMGTLGMGMGVSSGEVYIEPDPTLTMWSNAPQGFEWDDWGTFIAETFNPQPDGSVPSSFRRSL